MSSERLMYYHLQTESSGWLFMSPLAGAGAYIGPSVPQQAAQFVNNANVKWTTPECIG